MNFYSLFCSFSNTSNIKQIYMKKILSINKNRWPNIKVIKNLTGKKAEHNLTILNLLNNHIKKNLNWLSETKIEYFTIKKVQELTIWVIRLFFFVFYWIFINLKYDVHKTDKSLIRFQSHKPMSKIYNIIFE